MTTLRPVRALTYCACAAIGIAALTLTLGASAGPAALTDAADAQAEAATPAAQPAAPTATPDAGPGDGAAPAPPPASAPDAAGGAGADAEAPPSSGPSGVGFAIGLRFGYAAPFGAAKNSSLSDVVSHAFPIGLEAGYFLNRHLYLGGYVLYGFATNGFASQTCSDPDFTCSANQWRFGGMAQWNFAPERLLSPWVGGALGYDIVNITATDSTGASASSASLHGLELSLLAGLEIRPLRYLGVGPYMELSMGHYTGADSATSLYEWLAIGIRGHTGL
jgi:hypothetical protein